ncbi:MAG: hypothetical protein HY898_22340 [Deltaproteobacteria bacterium]|nr:hypothetical protein [Deltaproteobacteria bacterium]
MNATDTIKACGASSACSETARPLDSSTPAATLEEPSSLGYATLSAVDIVEQLAKLILKNVANGRDLEKTQRKLDRDEQYRSQQLQVQAMRDKAGSIMDGAIASGLLSIGSGACSVYDATRTTPKNGALKEVPADADSTGRSATLQESRSGAGATQIDEVKNHAPSKWAAVPGAIAPSLGQSSTLAGRAFGDAPAAGHDADAKAAELAATCAKDRASDHADRIQELNALAQEAMQAIRSAQASHNEMVQGILRRM